MAKKSITTLPKALAAAGYQPPSYRVIYMRAVSDVFPAEQRDNGRWTYSPDDIPQIAAALKLRRSVAQAAA